ncbi:MAG: TIGR03663 family protein [Oligoflexia bacterium]|nr:TIGR03663 family protein [Oligoflexia bacterium]
MSISKYFENLQCYFTKKEWMIFFVIIFLGISLRWVSLDVRPFHHDEALVGIYGYYTYSDPDNKFYRYNPLLHGPLMFSVLPSFYNIIGVSNWSVRAPMAFLGTLFLFVPLLFRRFFHRTTLLAFTAVWALSPVFIYYSRFMQHDYLIFPSMMLMLYGVCVAKDENRSFFVLMGIVLQLCVKLNIYVNLTIIAGFLIYQALILEFIRRKASNTNTKFQEISLIRKMLDNIKKYPWRFLLSLAVAVFIYCYLFSAGFKYPKGILDGLYRESIPYWMNQHNIERIKGPYLFNFFFLSWYEFIFIVGFFVHYIHFYLKANIRYRLFALLSILFSIVVYLCYKQEYIEMSFIWSFFKFKIALDSFGPFIFLGHGIAVTTYHIMNRDQKLAFFGYMFMANFFTYSYLGEKVPWLALYILFPGTVYLAFYYEKLYTSWKDAANYFSNYSVKRFLCYVSIVIASLWLLFLLEDAINIGMADVLFTNVYLLTFSLVIMLFVGYLHFREKNQKNGSALQFNLKLWAFVFLCLFNLKMAIITNFSRAGSDTELISQVHTSQPFHDIALTIQREMETGVKGDRPMLLTLGASIWPMTWYMRDLRSFYSFNVNNMNVSKNQYTYIIDDPNTFDPSIKETHSIQYIPLRHWWVPEYAEMTIKKFLAYSFDHIPWNRSGAMFVLFARKKS